MKAEVELRNALKELGQEFEYGIQIKERLVNKLSNLVAVLEVFTDLNFTEKEQSQLFDISAIRVKLLEEKFK